ncbi:ATP-dependent helicase [Nitrosophilus alvini]|uniref:ATP-dependent helicase n=1 Tax=Nitrosophilus alvini TaxID=2714855 RepID=UPI0019096BC5|nr:ATP-dependent helicase [Nitrosophilus alvini]
MPLSKLNPEQFEAATAPFGQNLIIASAGTGKTSTIVGRIAYLIESGIRPEDILLLTFTNKASAEMISRISGYFGKSKASKIEAGTFHAVSYRWLKKLDEKVVLKQPKELKTLFKSVYEKRVFHHIESETKPYSAAYLFDIYSLYQNVAPQKSFSEWLSKDKEEHKAFGDIYDAIIDDYESLKKEYGFLGFNDLLIEAAKNAHKIGSFKEILVDEYQDTNNLQSALLDNLDCSSLFCVGDYDQSIYAFNGANINIIAGFKTKYPDANIYNLSKNYRSTKYILSLAQKVISNNERIYPKKLEVIKSGKCEAPKLLVYEELMEQYKAIAHKIKHSFTPKEEIAVIFRNNSSADGIEAGLRELGVGCRRKGGVSFFDAKEIKALFDVIALLINPKDVMAFIHLFEYAKGVGPAIAKEIYDALVRLGEGDFIKGLYEPKEMDNPFEKRIKNHQLGLFDDFLHIGSKTRFKNLGFSEKFMSSPVLKHPKLSSEGALFLYYLYNLIKELKMAKNPVTIVSKIVSSKLYGEIIEHLCSKRAANRDGSIDERVKTEAKERITRKNLLVKELAKHYSDINRFYNAMILGSSELSEGEGVNLLTVHASKGLEFEEVYIIDLMDGRFPNRKLITKGGSLEEERRLFYVAVTRAKSRLYLSYAKYDRVKKQEFLPSPFLFEAGLV